MANWALPQLSDLKVDVLDMLKQREVDAYTLAEAPMNPPVGAVRWNRSLNKFQSWNGTAWVDLIISMAGGGTGASDINGFLDNFNLGSMALQDSDNVSISGGSIYNLAGLSTLGNLGVSGNTNISGVLTVAGNSALATASFSGATSFNGLATFNAALKTPSIDVNSNTPLIHFTDADSPADNKLWRTIVNGDQFAIEAIKDDYSVISTGFIMTRSGPYVTDYRFGAGNRDVVIKMNAGPSGTQGFLFMQNGLTGFGAVYNNASGFYIDQTMQVFRTLDGANNRAIFSDTGLKLVPNSSTLASRVSVGEHTSNPAPAILQSGEAGTSVNTVLVANNFYSPSGGASSRVNTTVGGSIIRLNPNNITLAVISSTGIQTTVASFNSNQTFLFYNPVFFGPDNTYPKITPLAANQLEIYCNGILNIIGTSSTRISTGNLFLNNVGATNVAPLFFGPDGTWPSIVASSTGALAIRSPKTFFGASTTGFIGDDGAGKLQIGSTGGSDTVIYNTTLRPWADQGVHCGTPSFRWHTVYASNGVVTTSDERHKSIEGKIKNARELVRQINPMFGSIEPLEGERRRIVPMFSAQDLDATLSDVVYKENPEAWGINYSNLIPVLWQAVQDILNDQD
jgi:hypothetical protein